MWTLAWRNVLRNKSRTAMTLLAIIVGVMSLILSGGFIHDIITQFGEILIHSQSGHLQVGRQGYFAQGARSPEKFLIRDPRPLRESLQLIPGVDDAMGRLYFSGLLNNGRADLPIIGEGIEPAREAKLGTGLKMLSGRSLQDADRYAAMIGNGLAMTMKLAVGQSITVVTNTPDGALNSLEIEVVGIFQTFSKDYDARALRLPLVTAQELMAVDGINTLVLSLAKTEETAVVAGLAAERVAGKGLEVKTWEELNDFYINAVAMYDAQFGVLRLIILMMVLLSVANSVNIGVFERVGEFGTMMSMGTPVGGLFRLIVAENTLIGVAGASLGVLCGVLAAIGISTVGITMPPPPNSEMAYVGHIKLVPGIIATAFAIGFVATIAASLMPAARIRQTPIVEALRQNI